MGGAMEMSVGAGVFDRSSLPQAASGRTRAARADGQTAARRDVRGTTEVWDTSSWSRDGEMGTLPSRPQRLPGQPRPTYGIDVAITVMVSTFASGGRLAM